MKAVRLLETGRSLQVQSVELPPLGPDEVLVRVGAAGVCHSDAHYRAGTTPAGPLPLTVGHEVAGSVDSIGSAVCEFTVGDRVCVHYLVTCGECSFCRQGTEQFCLHGQMIGKDRDGGYAEYIVMPERSLVALPEAVSFEEGAVMMCSASTSLHALRKGRLRTGENVAVFGVGGLGVAAVQLAHLLGAAQVFAVDLKRAKLKVAESFGAIPIDAASVDPVVAIRGLTQGRGVDVAIEVIGLPKTIQQSLRVLAIGGRAVVAGVTKEMVSIATYTELLCREAELIGSSDHVKPELVELASLVADGRLDLRIGISRVIGLDAGEINAALDQLDSFGDDIRTVIVP